MKIRILNLLFCVVALLPVSHATGENLKVSIINLRSETGLADAVIELIPLHGEKKVPVARVAEIDQIGKEFVSGLTVVPAGSRIRFPNSDEIMHHVYSFSAAKTFDIPLYRSDERVETFVLFDTPGIVEIGCNIHDWMLAYIYVTDNEQVAKTDKTGSATLSGLAPGEYVMKVWHPRMGSGQFHKESLEILAGKDMDISLNLDLAPERRIRRSPSATSGRYR